MSQPTQEQQAALEKLVKQKRQLGRLRTIIYFLAVFGVAAVSYIIGKNQVRLEDALITKDSTISKKNKTIAGKDSVITQTKTIDSFLAVEKKKDPAARPHPAIIIRYFSQLNDGDYIKALLESSGYTWEKGEGRNETTNAIWQGADVPDKDFENVVLLLLKGGVQIQQIEKLSNPDKRNLIEIGHSKKSENKTVFTVDDFLKIKGKALAY